ncbi:LamG-like jellyroll fold domain-containing protein, partial [Vibrio nomapromontoriensis]|uniref:LamG-like jellyroll fold domain-containing protein n=1 Tax=Vibrio nomapromontoriensis TaxID=2910246 RepID=UPI003D148DF8
RQTPRSPGFDVVNEQQSVTITGENYQSSHQMAWNSTLVLDELALGDYELVVSQVGAYSPVPSSQLLTISGRTPNVTATWLMSGDSTTGKALYEANCTGCHTGSYAPDLVGDVSVKAAWSERTLTQLTTKVGLMPVVACDDLCRQKVASYLWYDAWGNETEVPIELGEITLTLNAIEAGAEGESATLMLRGEDVRMEVTVTEGTPETRIDLPLQDYTISFVSSSGILEPMGRQFTLSSETPSLNLNFDFYVTDSTDTDNDGISDFRDNDDDNDGTLDVDDSHPKDHLLADSSLLVYLSFAEETVGEKTSNSWIDIIDPRSEVPLGVTTSMYKASFVAGKVGLAANGSQFNINGLGPYITDAFTVSYWINSIQNLDNSNMFGPGASKFIAYHDSGDNLRIGIKTREQISVPIIGHNQWTLITYTYENNTQRLYRNGVLEVESTASDPAEWASVYFKKYAGSLIDEVRIYNRAITSTEVSNLHVNRSAIRDGDIDGDGILDSIDKDRDGDGVYNDLDWSPNDPNEWLDTDADGIGNNADTDDDNDGVLDAFDGQPLDPLRSDFEEQVDVDPLLATINELNTLVIQAACIKCHTSEGQASPSEIHLVKGDDSVVARQNADLLYDYIDNFDTEIVNILAKPAGQVIHGGGTVFADTTNEWKILRSVLYRAYGRAVPADTAETKDFVLASNDRVYRKAALTLTGLVPSNAELLAARGWTEDQLNQAIEGLLVNSEGLKTFITQGVDDRLLLNEILIRPQTKDDIFFQSGKYYPYVYDNYSLPLYSQHAERAIDDNLKLSVHSASKTLGGEWLDIDLGKSQLIERVSVRHKSLYKSRADIMSISISNTPFNGRSNSELAEEQDIWTVKLRDYIDQSYDKEEETTHYLNIEKSGRYVRLSTPYKNPIHFNEVDIFDVNGMDITKGRSATISSLYLVHDGIVSEATTRFVNEMIEAPKELVWDVVSRDLDYTKILTADYTMAGPESYKWFTGSDGGSPLYQRVTDSQYRGTLGDPLARPHVGLLSMYGYLTRFDNTDTNFNRHRANETLKNFLHYDIEKNLARAVSTADVDNADNPTMDNPVCANCHITMDPIAAGFQNFAHAGGYKIHDGKHSLVLQAPGYENGLTWYTDIRSAGFNGIKTPIQVEPLQWLAESLVQDERFFTGTVRFWWQSVFGREFMDAPAPESADYNQLYSLYEKQQELVIELADNFKAHLDLKQLLQEMIMSEHFRAESVKESVEEDVRGLLASYSKVTPESYVARLASMTGGYRGDPSGMWNGDGYLDSLSNRTFYGGIDGKGTDIRVDELTPLSLNLAKSLANQYSCTVVLHDVLVPESERKLLKGIDYNWIPTIVEDPAKPVPLPSPVSRLSFEKLNDLGHDSISNINKGIVAGSVRLLRSNSGHYAEFDASDNQGIHVPTWPMNNAQIQFAVSLTMTPSQTSRGHVGLVNLRSQANSGFTVTQRYNRLELEWRDGVSTFYSPRFGNFNANEETALLIQFSGTKRDSGLYQGRFSIFQDGTKIGVIDIENINLENENYISFGKRREGITKYASIYQGLFDDIQIYNQLLSDEQIYYLSVVDNFDLKDSDNDGVFDVVDAFPNDPTESLDTDRDTVGNSEDTDDDNDGVLDIDDAFPVDIAASVDADSDGYPDAWNVGFNQSDSTTGLMLDEFLNNPTMDQTEHNIRLKIADIMYQSWGRRVPLDSAEIDRAYELFVDKVKLHQSNPLPYIWSSADKNVLCAYQGESSDWQDAPEDTHGTMGAWRLVVAYVMTDFEYLYH